MSTIAQNLEGELDQPWKKWMAKEIAARREAELDTTKKVEQERLRREYERSGQAQRVCNPTIMGDGHKIHYPVNAAG